MGEFRMGVILSGSGVYDGSELHEAVLTLLAIDRAGARAVCAAPDIPQAHVIDHLSGQPVEGESRRVLAESARISRGEIQDLAGLRAGELDAIILPGGFGAAKNLCDFAFNGAECTVHREVGRLVLEALEAGIPVGAMCIAPVILAKVLGPRNPLLTIGSDPGTAAALESMGARHQNCATADVVIDTELKLVTTPAYMTAASIAEAAVGIEKLVQTVIDLARR